MNAVRLEDIIAEEGTGSRVSVTGRMLGELTISDLMRSLDATPASPSVTSASTTPALPPAITFAEDEE